MPSNAGNLTEAETHWRMVLAAQPDFHSARLGLADVYLRQRRWTGLEQTAGALAEIGQTAEGELLRAQEKITTESPEERRQSTPRITRIARIKAQATRICLLGLFSYPCDPCNPWLKCFCCHEDPPRSGGLPS